MTNLEEEIMWELKSQAMLKRLRERVRKQKQVRALWVGVSSLAACILFVGIFGWCGIKNQMYNLSTEAINQFEVETVRGDVDVMRINNFHNMLKQEGDVLRQADDSISNFIDELSNRTYPDDLVGYYYKDMDRELLEDAEYLQAVCTMKRGDVIRANEMLSKIRKGGGVYASSAEELLRESNGFSLSNIIKLVTE